MAHHTLNLFLILILIFFFDLDLQKISPRKKCTVHIFCMFCSVVRVPLDRIFSMSYEETLLRSFSLEDCFYVLPSTTSTCTEFWSLNTIFAMLALLLPPPFSSLVAILRPRQDWKLGIFLVGSICTWKSPILFYKIDWPSVQLMKHVYLSISVSANLSISV